MTFPIRFLICNVFISLLLGIILLTKKILKKHITSKTQYQLWYIFVFSLFLPFVPYRLFRPECLFSQLQQWLSLGSAPASSAASGLYAPTASSDLVLDDFSMAIASSNTGLVTALWIIWIAGMMTAVFYLLHTIIKIYLLRKNAYRINAQNEPDLHRRFSVCLQELHIRRKVRLYASCALSSPVSYGWFRPTVIIPQDLDILLTEKEIRFIFLHELQHCKHRDAILNDLVCLLQIIYWFNPFIRYGFHQLQKDREIACDYSVIHIIGQSKRLDYGYTIIRYAEHMQKGRFFSPLSAMGGSKDTIRQRIIEIANYQKDSLYKKTKSTGVIILTLLLIYGTSPFYTAYAASDASFHLQSDNWELIDASSYFNGIDGSFVLYDMTNDHYQIYNMELSEHRSSPDSTFKIYSGLFALEENIITPHASLQKWDGTIQPFDAWNQDQTLNTAMKSSVNWYFQNLDKQSGPATLYAYYHKISYGNCDLTGGPEQYWCESSLKISPIEQVMLLSKLTQNEWHFKEENIEAIKDSLFIADIPAGKLYGKTGTGSDGGHNTNGWFVGFIENNGHIYCFATNLQHSDMANGSTAAEITINILNKRDF